jgi:hypothetical protein
MIDKVVNIPYYHQDDFRHGLTYTTLPVYSITYEKELAEEDTRDSHYLFPLFAEALAVSIEAVHKLLCLL